MGKHIVSMMLAALIGLGPSIQEMYHKDPAQPAFSNKSISGFSYGKVPKSCPGFLGQIGQIPAV